MRVMVLANATDGSEKGFTPSPWTTGMMKAMGRFNDELRAAGFWLWEVKDMDEAIAGAKRCPNPMSGPSEIEIEIRPLYEAVDLG